MYVHKTPPTPPQNTRFPGLNLKVGKMNYRLGEMDPNWAKCLRSGQNVSRSGPKKKFILSPPTSGLARRRRPVVRSWTESLLSTPLSLWPSSLGLARRGRRMGEQLDGAFAFYASHLLLRAWAGGGGGGVRKVYSQSQR